MVDLDRPRPQSFPFPCLGDLNTARNGVERPLYTERIHSWPFCSNVREAAFLPSATNIVRGSCSSSLSIGPIHEPFPRAHVIPPGSWPQKSSELPGSLDNSPNTAYCAHATTSLSDVVPPTPPPKPSARSSQREEAESPRCLCQQCLSISVPFAPDCLPHGGGFDDLRHEYTLKEALELLPNKVRNGSNQSIMDSSTGRIIPAYLGTWEEHTFPDTEALQDSAGGCEWQQKQFFGQNIEQYTTWPEPHIQSGNEAKRPMAKVVTKVVKPLTLLFSKFFKGSAAPSEQTKSGKGRQTLSSRDFRREIAKSQNVESSDLFGEQVSVLAQSGRDERDAFHTVPANVRRLSITGSFGPTLTQSIEEVTPNPKSTDIALLSSFHACLNQPVSSARATFLTRQTPRIVRFQEPEGRRRRPHLHIHIPPSPSYLSSARARDPSRQPPFPATRPPTLLSEQRPNTDISLRGGCLPIPRTRHPPPRSRVDPALRPADQVRVPPGLWYLAGGRPVLRDNPGQPCYHGQPKPRRRFKNRRGLEEVGISRQRVPNTQPCEPLTFGHLRTWKQKSRPADRLNPQTGYMEPIYRPFWQEFAHSVSRGKVGTKRPRRELGAGKAYYGRGQGLAGGGDDIYGSRPTDIGQDSVGRSGPDSTMSVGAGRAQSDYDMSGALGPDPAAGNSAGPAA